ncbi:MAG: phospholipase D family protein, partial [Pseudomonadota bacterium]|nr:phospholipase D family protein [Pseudomonadota bacterium]
VQYYIWHNDMSGTLLFEALRQAADRGVRVRLLLDDFNTKGLDTILSALDAHPYIEVRLFNPVVHRQWRILDYLTDFSRLNRRMHNKSFTADNQVTIVGGRNVGDEYFGADQEDLFVDLDVMAIGPVVKDVSHQFDRYWASGSSYPADRLLPSIGPAAISAVAAAASRVQRDPASRAYTAAIARSPFVRQMLARHLQFDWAVTHVVCDDPAKALGRAAAKEYLWPRLKRILKAPRHELDLVSGYFVPTAAGVKYFTGLATQGVKIKVLTNSLEASDVAIVHAFYAKWRKPMVKAGIALFEIKSPSPVPSFGGSQLPISSGSIVHAKTFSVDRSRVFVGSFNFDPRSARLNTELGFVIDSPALAQRIAHAFTTRIPARAYKVRLSDEGALQWVEQRGAKTLVHNEEPGTSFWRRLVVSVMSVLPIEGLL